MAERVRTTVAMDPEVLEVFKAMADASGVSLSRCIGDWLADTSDGAQLVAQKMQEARRAPVTVLREMQAVLSGTREEVDARLQEIRARSFGAAERVASGGVGRKAPSSNTGLKSSAAASDQSLPDFIKELKTKGVKRSGRRS